MPDDFLQRISDILGSGYVVERELGAGMSRVVVARDVALGRQIVVKVLPADWAAGLSAERFRREVVLAAGLQHPHIVPLLSAAEAPDGTLYYTMPYIDGQSLRSRLKDGVPALADTVRWLRDVASALDYAHARGIVHRDMKPDNVLLSGSYALVADFGIAKALSSAVTESPRPSRATDPITTIGTSLGTPAYMAPEQVAADTDADHRADLYALGVIAYELLTGAPPFSGSSQAILVAHLTKEPPPLEQQRTDVPEALRTIVMQCLAKNADERPASAGSVVASLEVVQRMLSGNEAERSVARAAVSMAPTTTRVAAPSPTITPSATIATPSTPSWRGRAIAAVAVLVAAGAGGVALWPRVHAEPRVAGRVAVITFRDASRDGSLGDLSRTLTRDLADDLRTIDGADIVSHDDVARVESALAADSASPTAIAERLRAGIVVGGELSARGSDSVRIRVVISDGSDGRTIRTLREVDASRAELREAATAIGQRVGSVVMAATEADFTVAMLPNGDPPTREALAAVREGLMLEASLRQPAADEDESLAELVRFDLAVNADSTFQQARLWFASAALRRSGGEVLADSALAIVQMQASLLTAYERDLLEALRADVAGNHELSVRAWRRALAAAPAWPNRWWLANKLRDANRPKEALAHVDTLGRADPHFLRSLPPLRHYVGDFAGEYAAVRAEQRRAPSTVQSLGFQQVLMQSLAALDSLPALRKLLDDAAQLPAEPGSSYAFLLTRTSWELAAHGHRKESAEALQRANAWCARRTASDFANSGVGFDCMEAYAYQGDVTALTALAEPALRARPTDVDLSVLGLLGVAAGLRGERAIAEQFVQRIEQATRADGSHGFASWLRARIAAALGDTTRAVELLEDAFARGAGWSQRLDLHRDPAFARVRSDPRFARLHSPQG